ncbi:MAG TPA: FadR/GntR family transcriptional regulator [Casimicrobiaceae bacterium]|jgi:GntR family transcriptional repressor for pyruvate dehydrogenase complex|nr:FadR/GntR family transcriptional regulator [Casimicrobiaceae bacterium]
MSLHLVQRRGAVADVLARLQAQIAEGRYPPDARLPSESELCKAFGVSRPVVREALMSLQALGLTTSQPGIGTFVVSDRVRVPLLMGRYSPAHVREVRRCIEIPAARLSAERRSDRDVGELAGILARMEEADNPARRNLLDASFHIAIARSAGNPLIVKLVEDLRSVLEEHSLAAARVPYRRRAAAEEHRAIYDAIVDRDPDGAAAAMEAHLAAAERSFADPASKEARAK